MECLISHFLDQNIQFSVVPNSNKQKSTCKYFKHMKILESSTF